MTATLATSPSPGSGTTEAPVTFITGTSSGIGEMLARHYLAKGHRVVGLSRRPVDGLGDDYLHLEGDVTDEAVVRAAFSEVRRRYGGVDHLVNNAGVASMNHALLTTAAALQRLLEVNVQGAFLASREAAKLMQRRRHGRIVNFTTVAVPLALAGEAAYVASKAAVEAMTRVLARELAPFGITVNAVGPTPIRTALIAGVPEATLDALVAQQPIARFGTPADVANVVDFFLAASSDFVTGQVIYLGGVS